MKFSVMGGLLFILPILAFDVWLTYTTGRRQWRKWRETNAWRPMTAVVIAGLLLAVVFAFVFEFKNGTKLRLKGFPVPFAFFSLENDQWITTTSAAPLELLSRVTDAVTGLAAPLIPFKIAEFLRVVKEEIK
jgi:hypothetical protein